MLTQLQHCEESGIPLAVVLGESELKRGVVKVRNITTRLEEEVSRADLIQELKKRIAALSGKEMNGVWVSKSLFILRTSFVEREFDVDCDKLVKITKMILNISKNSY